MQVASLDKHNNTYQLDAATGGNVEYSKGA